MLTTHSAMVGLARLIGIGLMVIGEGRTERLGDQPARLSRRAGRIGGAEARQEALASEHRVGLLHPPAQRRQIVIGQRPAHDLAQRADDAPILARLAGRMHGLRPALHAPLGVHIGAGLLGIGGARQNQVGARRAAIAMMSLIDDEGLAADAIGVELVGAEQPHDVDAAAHHLREALRSRSRHEAEIECADPRGGGVQHVEAMPLGAERPDFARQRPGGGEHRRAVRTRHRRRAENDHRPLGRVQRPGNFAGRIEQHPRQMRAVARVLHVVGEVRGGADQPDRHPGMEPAPADARVQNRRLAARVGADQQHRVGLVDARDGAVEDVEIAPRRIEQTAVLAAIEIGRTPARQQVLERHHALDVAQIAGDGADPLARHRAEAFGQHGEGIRPGRRHQPAVAPHPRPVQPPPLQPVEREARLVAQPLLVHVIVQSRQDAQHFGAARIDADVAALRIEHIDAVGLLQLPGAGDEGIGLRGQRPHRAKIDDVGRKLAPQRLLDIGADLHVLAARGGAEIGHARHLGDKADAARAVDATRHHRLHQRAQVLVLHRALVFLVARVVHPVTERLVLQVALAALVADRAVERVVDEQELHHPAAGVAHHLGVGVHHHALGDRPGAGGDRLRRRLLDLHQAHAAIAGNRQPVVIAEPRHLDARRLAGLQDRGSGGDFDLDAVDGELGHRAPYSAASGMRGTPIRIL